MKLDRERIRISQPAPVVVEGDKKIISVPARQVTIPSGELARLKMVQEREFAKLKAEQEKKMDQRKEPTSLVGAVRELNSRNSVDRTGRTSTGAQQRLRLRERSRSGSSVRFLEEKKSGNPERERERGKSVARTAPPQVAAAPLQVAAVS